MARTLGIRQDFEFKGDDQVSVKMIADLLATEIIFIWERAAIPVIRKDKIKEKILKCIQEFELKLKNWKRHEENPEKLNTNRQSIVQLIDSAPSNLEAVLRSTSKTNANWEDDLLFYQNQSHVPQIGSLGTRDVVLAKRIQKNTFLDFLHHPWNMTTNRKK